MLLPNVPGATFIQGAKFIPESRVQVGEIEWAWTELLATKVKEISESNFDVLISSKNQQGFYIKHLSQVIGNWMTLENNLVSKS